MSARKKKWWKSWTLWVNAALAMGTVAEAHFDLLQAVLGPKAYLAGMTIIAGINFVLRFKTSEAIVDVKPPAAKP